ncbi:GntR family transcriptional regulator [Thermosediminibacter oceani]|uniref:Transcriptional regulator, GntR family n=1 Tax=Thermosediminibacter oceani (strain ATCC BAA-1034 / DSM 16646 / JW/IW-1228P) TaxID=555079 RepID=D9S0U2_THEOJ|nr:GntR family transcriptional regulator [Thermosediminibacter oceani]ADL07106.1 transcriptional regulator, GntR family [Thermosediminibacter oceani DSM 16646]
MLDKKSPIPAYFRLKQIIRDEIKRHDLKPGDPLPSEREYCERFGLSRMTVRQALKELELEGVIVREKGRGSFVAIPWIEQEGLMSFTEMVRSRGMTPRTEVVEFDRLPAGELKAFLGIDLKEEVYRVARLRKADGVPVAVETVYIPVLLVPDFEKIDLSGSLYELLSTRYGIEVRSSRTSFSAVLSTPDLEALLMLEETVPLLKVESVYFHTKPVFYEVSYYKSDQFKITVNLNR